MEASETQPRAYKNERFDDILSKARQITDQAKYAEFYREAQKILVEVADGPAVPSLGAMVRREAR